MSLSPPAVDPIPPPIIMSMMSSPSENSDQSEKLIVEYPVVEIADPTLISDSYIAFIIGSLL